MQENQYLSIIAQGANNTEFLREIAHLVAQHDCQMQNLHILAQGNDLSTLNFLISGPWSVVAKLETKFKTLAHKFSIEIFLKRTTPIQYEKPMLSYFIYISSLDNPQAFYQIMRFLHQHQIEVSELFIDNYKTRSTKTTMTSFTIKIILPGDTAISDWRDRFMLFCDDLNFDAVMEPEKA